MYAHLLGYTTQQLEERRRFLEDRRDRADSWASEARSERGRSRIEELEREIENVRQLYSMIPPHLPEAMTVLAGLQGEERAYKSTLRRMRNATEEKKVVEQEIKSIVEMILVRQKAQEAVRSTIVPTKRGDQSK